MNKPSNSTTDRTLRILAARYRQASIDFINNWITAERAARALTESENRLKQLEQTIKQQAQTACDN